MRTIERKLNFRPALASILGLALALGVSTLPPANAGDEEDLSDNEVCLGCHADQEHVGLLKVEGAQVHNPKDGSLQVEAHTEFACIDCHSDIMEIPHKEDVERTVDCLNCHEEQPHQ